MNFQTLFILMVFGVTLFWTTASFECDHDADRNQMTCFDFVDSDFPLQELGGEFQTLVICNSTSVTRQVKTHFDLISFNL